MPERPISAHPVQPPDWAEEDLVSAILAASRVLVAVAARSLGRVAEDLTLPQFRILVLLRTRGAMSPGDLAEQLSVAPEAAFRMVDVLLTGGLVLRLPAGHDGPGEHVELSEAGERMVAEVTERRRVEIARIVREMPPDDRAGLAVALHAFARAGGEAIPHRESDFLVW
ncbi:MarR family winged helix-turn-helix transcriptional regulator [Kitasatospora sp. NPDC004240]